MDVDAAAESAPDWTPLSVRDDPVRLTEFRAAREGVPDGMRRSAVEWCVGIYFRTSRDRSPTYRARLMDFERSTDRQLPRGVYDYRETWAHVLANDDELLLDATDFALKWADEMDRLALTVILRSSRSVYRVGQGGSSRFELQKSYPDELVKLVETTASQPGRSAEHLRIAWSRLAGRQPDPGGACWEAAKAIEAAAKSVIIPDDGRPTLGKMLKAMEAKPAHWETCLTPAVSVERVMEMMRMVWEEGLRHGDEAAPLQVTQEAAEMVVHTAVLLTHWFESGLVRRRVD